MENLDENALSIYTDGSSYSHPRKGGFGARFIWYDEELEEIIYDHTSIGYSGATNQQMELKACVDALNLILLNGSPITSNFSKIIIYTDSMYIVENINQAKFTWSKNKWRSYTGAPIKNAELWKELIKIMQKLRKRVDFKWVKGHKSSVHNKAVDKIAKLSAKQAGKQRLSYVRVRRKISDKATELGSVEMKNQKITIRIVSDEYLKVQKCYIYKYEVLTRTSPYFNNVDSITSDIMLNAGHTYYVQLNKLQKNPQIIKLFREIKSRT